LQREGRSVATVLNGHATAMRFGDLAHDGESKACPIRSSGRERFEQMLADRGGYAFACISDG
jgi:hypothetical protein